MKIILNFILALSLVFIACKSDPEPINFGTDECAHCKMTIVDKKFGAEIVSKKGKIFKFDAAECMINFVNKGRLNENEVEQYLVIDFTQPEKLIDAVNAVYLISENLPSPMGANLSAYPDKSSAEAAKNNKGGNNYGWEELKNKLKR
jgi:copper chaperone NosL